LTDIAKYLFTFGHQGHKMGTDDAENRNNKLYTSS